ncbi:MAG: helix-turn-helix domain-containing protein [Eisenbergiella porci]|uniref:helix-turn-helix domain-containing protein n=1 Tax=Eisenbergiella porci TaxID=2652274 RepID=UPI002A759CF3|nr:helix-turn-helix domain-containing protein [Eisenbergiella porci]MDY2655011.1 helix-turn-helix domain-containing protein [Eisenbergiella porci]
MDTVIGQRIKERRKELHITQNEIQESCGISTGNLSGIETGRYLPSAVALIQLSQILKCSIDWMLTGKSSISENLISVDIKEKTLIEYFRQMTSEDQEELMMIGRMKANKGKRAKSVKSSHSGLENETSDIA